VHELALMDDLVAAVTTEVSDARVHVVRLEIGRLSCASPHALRFCFEVCAQGTPLEGASLEIVEIDGDGMRLKELEVS
jgi:hydrogenase nickel incorporation protein HypA/HybF